MKYRCTIHGTIVTSGHFLFAVNLSNRTYTQCCLLTSKVVVLATILMLVAKRYS